MSSDSVHPAAYETYSEWKNWQDPERYDDFGEIFAEEMRRAQLEPGARLLEIGFGNGTFLDWARSAGYQVVGVELIPELVAAAVARNHVAYHGTVSELAGSIPGGFDGVMLFNVLEHLSKEQILSTLRVIGGMLKPMGVVVASFPNGGSPFGRHHQHGDITHTTTLSGSSIAQIAMMTGMRVQGVYNAARSLRGGRRPGIRLLKAAAYAVRGGVELLAGYLYYGARVPLDPDLTVVIAKQE